MEKKLTKEQKIEIGKLLTENRLQEPAEWYDEEEYNVDASYSEVLGGYIIQDETTRCLLSDMFGPQEPVEPQGVSDIEPHALHDHVSSLASQASLKRCNVAYVSIGF